jgi:hypothetical protein
MLTNITLYVTHRRSRLILQHFARKTDGSSFPATTLNRYQQVLEQTNTVRFSPTDFLLMGTGVSLGAPIP